MIKSISTVYNRCPHPEACPFGPKRQGYSCRMSFELRVSGQKPAAPGAEPEKVAQSEFHCSFCEINLTAFQRLITGGGRQGPGLVVAGPGSMPPGGG